MKSIRHSLAVRSPRAIALLCVSVLFNASASPASALTPQSPEVQQAVAKAVAFLASQRPNKEIGVEALIGLAVFKGLKNDDPASHPRVQQAIARVREAAKTGKGLPGYEVVYRTAVCVIFLTAVDKRAYRAEVEALTQRILEHQLPHGGFAGTERSKPTAAGGDTSMTQYAVLAMWEATQAGVDVPASAWQNVLGWLTQTQMSDGGFGYNPPVRNDPTPSRAVAGLGSLYICAAVSGAADKPQAKDRPPGSFEKVTNEAGGNERVTVSLNIAAVGRAVTKGNVWLERRFTVDPKDWPLYYLYGLERYQSFRELVENRNDPEPQWYTLGAEHLLKTQLRNGSWEGGHDIGGPVSGAFGVLFLVRSTRKSLQGEPGASGELVGGRGLPDSDDLRLNNGKVVADPLDGPAEQLLAAMEDPADPRFEAAAQGLLERVVEKDDAMLPESLLRLRALAGSDAPAARVAAIVALGRAGKMDDVPTIIFALSDKDVRVARAARDALRFVSRKFEGFGLEFDPDPVKRARAVAEAAAKWRAWYRGVRPDARFDAKAED